MAEVQRGMTLWYEGRDITDEVDIVECVCRDVSGGQRDALNLKVDHAGEWFRWAPRKNDRLRVTRSGYDTGEMFLTAIIPEDGAYRIIATGAAALPCPARWQAFEKASLMSVMSQVAGECGMTARLFGLGGGITYEYLMRMNERAPAFLERLAGYEGAALKALGGTFTAIGIGYAQGLPAMHEMRLDDDQTDSEYLDRRDANWASVTIDTPFGFGAARDSGASGQSVTISDIAVDDDAQAYRWARGMLLMHNRKSEELNIEMDFNPGYTALARVDVTSRTDAAGKWLIDEVEQNLWEGRTRARLYRCVGTIM